MPANRRLTPIQDRRTGTTNIRWLDRGGSKASQSTQWASCNTNITVVNFRRHIPFPGSQSTMQDGSGLGLALIAGLGFAFVGPVAGIAVLAGAAIYAIAKPETAAFTNFNRPCDPDAGKY
jgi:hypothetical protein